MRRAAIGIAAGALLGALAASVGAHALWGRTVPLDDGIVSSGDFAVTAQWVDAPNWTPMFPGDAREATMRVTSSGAGATLRWRLFVAGGVVALNPYAQFAAWQGACEAGTPIGAQGYPTTLAPGATVDVCVRITLSATAPSSLQNASASPAIVVTGRQVGG